MNITTLPSQPAFGMGLRHFKKTGGGEEVVTEFPTPHTDQGAFSRPATVHTGNRDLERVVVTGAAADLVREEALRLGGRIKPTNDPDTFTTDPTGLMALSFKAGLQEGLSSPEGNEGPG